MMNTQKQRSPNGLNGSFGTFRCSSSGDDVVENQATHSCHQATDGPVNETHSRDKKRAILECYYVRRPGERGYRQRMRSLGQERGKFDITEQRMADKVRNIMKQKMNH